MGKFREALQEVYGLFGNLREFYMETLRETLREVYGNLAGIL